MCPLRCTHIPRIRPRFLVRLQRKFLCRRSLTRRLFASNRLRSLRSHSMDTGLFHHAGMRMLLQYAPPVLPPALPNATHTLPPAFPTAPHLNASLAPPPPMNGTMGYDMSCLYKSIFASHCETMPVTVGSIMSLMTAITIIALVVIIPVGLLYKSSLRGKSTVMWCMRGGGDKFPEYSDFERRAADRCNTMPRPPQSSQFRKEEYRPTP